MNTKQDIINAHFSLTSTFDEAYYDGYRERYRTLACYTIFGESGVINMGDICREPSAEEVLEAVLDQARSDFGRKMHTEVHEGQDGVVWALLYRGDVKELNLSGGKMVAYENDTITVADAEVSGYTHKDTEFEGDHEEAAWLLLALLNDAN